MARSKSYVIPSIFTAVDKFSGPLSKMSKNSDVAFARMQRRMRSLHTSALNISKKSAIVAATVATPMVLMANEAIKFEDKMADVAKTTGLADKALENYGLNLLKISENSRTGINDLIDIGVVGGRLNIAKKDLVSFTDAANKFNVALGEDFSGGAEEAISSIGKIQSLFKETRDLGVSDAITRAGSVINDLSSSTKGTAPNITDFVLRVGNIPDALKPAITDVAALGAVLESSGVDAQRGSSGFSLLVIKAAKNVSKFAEQMGLSNKKAKELLSGNTLEFVKRFSKTFANLEPDVLAKKLKKFGLNSMEVLRVVGSLSVNSDKLTKVQMAQNGVFEKGTSLLDEYNVKNNTSQARILKAKNRFKSLSITLGNLLIPVLNQLLDTVLPLIKRFSSWTKENRGTTEFIIKLSLGVGLLSGAISIASGAVALYAKIMLNWTALSKFAVSVQLAWNAAVLANPIGVMVFAMLGAMAVVYSFTSATSKLTRAQRLSNEVTQRAIENTVDERVELEVLFKTLRRAEEGSNAYNKTLERLEEIQPGIVDKFNLYTKSLENMALAEDELKKSILNRAEAQARSEIIAEKLKQAIEIEQNGPSFADKFKGYFTGGPAGGYIEASKRAKELRADADFLINQQADSEIKALNPQKEKIEMQNSSIEKKTTEQVKIIFENLPKGVKVEGGSASIFGAPVLSSTRG